MSMVLTEMKRRVAEYKRAGWTNNEVIALARAIEHGKSYTRISKQKELRWRQQKLCFYNSCTTVLNRQELQLRYVEGFVLSKSGSLTHHAWVTRDGKHAIDVTLREERLGYYGIEVPREIMIHTMMRCAWLEPALFHWDPGLSPPASVPLSAG
jgi:hypothetical protein